MKNPPVTETESHECVAGRFRRLDRNAAPVSLVIFTLVFSACEGPQSALDAAGRGAEQIARLFWWMSAGAAFIWIVVVGLAIYAIRLKDEPHRRRPTAWLIIGGGALVPTVVLGGVLAYGLSMIPELLGSGKSGGVKIIVSGEQWWWRIAYHTPEGMVEVANEIRLPVGEAVEFELVSPDVIHSFWIPPLGGKMDMIPGRKTRLILEPTRTGVFRGACAEYCGTAHALMSFYVVVHETDDFAAWLQHQASPARAPQTPLAAHGRELFLANGCGACHAIRGTPAKGVIGPDLTHVGSRLSLGAGMLPNDGEARVRWLAETEKIKPGVHMPAFGMLPHEDIRALAAYMEALE